jgi:uncharacterized membrane protein YuzA (DUF378 family)
MAVSLTYRHWWIGDKSGAGTMIRGITDFFTLIVILAAGLQLGLQGFFGWDAAAHFFGDRERISFIVAGLSAVWQIFRQRFT